jgi:(p)ppGpp synthase/HD superfamily hydrolase
MRTFEGWPSWEAASAALAPVLPAPVLHRLGRAYAFAAERHAGQTRPAGEPYMEHLLQVVQVLVEGAGERDGDLLCAALLHDTVEDTATTVEELARVFGPRVAELVGWVTQPTPADPADRAEARQAYLRHLADAPPAALTLKLADRLSNVQRLDTHPRPDRQRGYYEETCRYVLPLAAGLPWFAGWFAQWRDRYSHLTVNG